jgi:hypothetical protein
MWIKQCVCEVEHFPKEIQELIGKHDKLENDEWNLDGRLGWLWGIITKHPAYDKGNRQEGERGKDSYCTWYYIAYSYGYILNSNDYPPSLKGMITRYQNIIESIRKKKQEKENVYNGLCQRLEERMEQKVKRCSKNRRGQICIRFY